MKNFPFEHDGKIYWYSRSIAVATFVFCKNEEGEWCILMNKRGKSLEKSPGKWNCCSGFLDFDEDVIGCAIRETYEETGLVLNPRLLNYHNHNSKPDTDRQTVTFFYYAILPGTIDKYTDFLTNEHCEPDEVDEIDWIPLSMIITSDMDIAFNHDMHILDIYNKHIAN